MVSNIFFVNLFCINKKFIIKTKNQRMIFFRIISVVLKNRTIFIFPIRTLKQEHKFEFFNI